MEVYGRCDPLPPRGPGTGGLRREQAPVPCAPAMASNHTRSRELATTQQAGPHEDGLTGSSGRPPTRGWRDEVPGSDQPQSSHVLYGTRGGFILWCLRVTSESTSAHQCPSLCLRAKDHLRTPGGGLPEILRPARRPVRQRIGLVATAEWTAEWTIVLRYGHVWSAPVVVDVGFTHGVGTAYTPCSLAWLHALCSGASSMAFCLSATSRTLRRVLCYDKRLLACQEEVFLWTTLSDAVVVAKTEFSGSRLLFPRNRATVWTRTFSTVRKSTAFLYYPLTAAFPGFAPGRLA